MAFKLNPEQQAVYDSMTSFKEKESYLEECQLEAAFNGDLSSEPEPNPEPEPAPAPEVEKPVIPDPVDDGKPVVADDGTDWKKEAETWKKRKSDADRALTPVQQENARLRKEGEARDSQLDELKSMLLDLQEKVAASKNPQRDADLESEDDEFSVAYPDVAKRIKAAEERSARLVEERLRNIEEDAKRRAQALELERQKAYQEKHEAAVRKAHPDLADLFDPNKRAPRLAEWAKTQPAMIQSAVYNPLEHTPEDVSFALSAFKAWDSPTAQKPSLGDMVQNARSKTHVADPVQLDYFSEDELSDKNINALLRKASHDPAAMDAIMAKYERSIMKLQRF